MKKITLIVGLMILTLFLASCTEGGSSGSGGGGSVGSFNGGDEGLTLEFASQSPPDKVRDNSGQPFAVRVLVKNEGEYDIPENSAFVALAGISPQALGVSDLSKAIPQIRGFKKQGSNTIPGGQQQVVFDNLQYTESVVSGSVPLTLIANVCYPYQTRTSVLVCINGNTVPAIDDRAEICELESDRSYSNSGGPVKVENVKQFPFGTSSIQIQFEIVHKETSSSANVYQSGTIDDNCNIQGNSPVSSEALFLRDKIKYTVETGISGLNCESTGTNTNTVTLADDRFVVTCVQDTTGQSEFEKPIAITLEYDYWDRIDKQIIVEHIER